MFARQACGVARREGKTFQAERAGVQSLKARKESR